MRCRAKFTKLKVVLFSVVASAQALIAGPPGHVVGWGGFSLPNEPGAVFTHIGVGWDYRMAIRNDGRLFLWGDNWDREDKAPAATTNLVAIAGGSAADGGGQRFDNCRRRK